MTRLAKIIILNGKNVKVCLLFVGTFQNYGASPANLDQSLGALKSSGMTARHQIKRRCLSTTSFVILSAPIRSPYSRVSTAAAAAARTRPVRRQRRRLQRRRNQQRRQLHQPLAWRLLRSVSRGAACWLRNFALVPCGHARFCGQLGLQADRHSSYNVARSNRHVARGCAAPLEIGAPLILCPPAWISFDLSSDYAKSADCGEQEQRSYCPTRCAYSTSDRTAHKKLTPVRYGEPTLQIW